MPDPSTLMKPWEEQASKLLGKLWSGKMLAVEVSDILTIWSQNRLGKNSSKAYNCAIESFLFEAPLFQTFPESQKVVAFELLGLLATNSAHAGHAKAIEDAKAAAERGVVKKAAQKSDAPGWGDRVRQNLDSKAPTQPQEALDVKLVPPPPGLELPAMAFCQSPTGLECVKEEEVKSRPETPVSPFRVRRAGSRGRGA